MELSYRVELVDQTLLFTTTIIQGRTKLLLWFQNVKLFWVIYLWIILCVLVLAQHGCHFWEGLNSGFQLTYCFRGYVEKYLFIDRIYIGLAVPQMRKSGWLLLLHAFILFAFGKNCFDILQPFDLLKLYYILKYKPYNHKKTVKSGYRPRLISEKYLT